MKNIQTILFCKWHTYGQDSIIIELKKMGYSVYTLELLLEETSDNNKIYDEVIICLRNSIQNTHSNIVFSVNYFSVISAVCAEKNIKYVSWCHDAPLYALFYENVKLPHNIIFSFDRQVVSRLKKKGMDNIYHLPYYSAVEFYDEVLKGKSAIGEGNSISFVGSTYENRSLYNDIRDILPSFTSGYLEGIMEAQQRVIGHNFLEKLITKSVENNLKQYFSIPISNDFLEEWSFLFSNAFLGMQVTHNERVQFLKAISENYPLHIYTRDDTSCIPNAINQGSIEYETKMPFVFRKSKINLNLTIRNIQSGVPLRVFDVLGCGGFLITNYQEEIDELFKDGVDLVEYYSLEDLLEKLGWYLDHEEIRKRIARNGYQKVKKYHTLSNRLPIIMDILNKTP